jgi:hypothetical protein
MGIACEKNDPDAIKGRDSFWPTFLQLIRFPLLTLSIKLGDLSSSGMSVLLNLHRKGSGTTSFRMWYIAQKHPRWTALDRYLCF